ncbi:DNA methyltransferase [Helicobacter pylori]
MNARYKNLDNDERGVWKSSDLSVGSAVWRNIYPIFNPYTKQEIYPPHGYSWLFSQEKLQELISDNRIFFSTSGFRFFCWERDDLRSGAQVEEKVYRY